MKKLLLSLTLLASSFGFSQILTQDFQGADWPPTGWTTETGDATRPWGFTTTIFNANGQATFNITGGKSACIAWIETPNDAHLTSPSFSLAGYSSATWTFNIKCGYEYQVDPFPNGDILARVSTDGGATWTTEWVEEDYGPYTDYETLNISLDLANYLGQSNVMIRIQYVGADADSVSVDDFVVSGNLGTNEVLADSFSTFPNPVNNVLNIKNSENTTINTISVVDINGRTVKTVNGGDVTEVAVNVADLSAGVYMVNIDTNAGKAVKKFIKN
ncbi:T9SS type A sorting domain-containing protein [Flavobacterium stagni]|uniref:T9SS type A sorting domain-containing protein n=1 Tax=Flavobacterium stagni TaxID=2506421 RepID=A0A4Q1KCR2_9FLAO|nr:T9SS type A sorting domain-containing protein [Flavobacterium stagni]RXR24023.1 T9SS type A sorting domain-containing protein [Flavobacterium stagni]